MVYNQGVDAVTDMKGRGFNFLMGVTSNTTGRFKSLGMTRMAAGSPVVEYPDPSIRNTLKSTLGMLTIMILKRVRVYFP